MSNKRPADGEVVRLGKLIVKAKVERCGDRNLPVFSMTMHNGIVRQSDRFKKTVASKDTSDYKVVFPNQLVVGFPIDEGVIYVQHFDGLGIMSPAYNVWDIDTNMVLPAYLELALHSPQSMEYYATQMKGTTARRRTLSADKLCAMRIPLPTLTQQKSIVKLFEQVKESLSIAEIRLSKLDELVKSRFVEMFGDPFANDFGWEERRLGDLLAIARGGSPRPIKEYLTDSPDGINWIKIGDAEPNSRYITRTAEKIKPEGEKKSRKVKSGDFLLSNSMSFGKPYILTIDGCIHDGWLVLSDYEEHFNKLFLWELLDSPALKMKFSSSVRGGVVNNLNKDLVADTVVPVPSLSLQCKFADFATHVDKLRTETQRQKQDLQTLYDSLAQEYFAM